MIKSNRYSFSFTATALRVSELEKVLRHLSLNEELDITELLVKTKEDTNE